MNDIYVHLRESEAQRRPKADYMDNIQRDINSTMRQGLTLVHFSAQPELFLTQNTAYTSPNTPYIPPTHPLNNPYMHPLSYRKRLS